MEAPTSLAFYLVDVLIDYSQYSMQLHDWSVNVMVESTTTSRLCLMTYIGFKFLSVSSFVWPFSSTIVELSTCRETCSGQQTVTPGNDYGHRQRTS